MSPSSSASTSRSSTPLGWVKRSTRASKKVDRHTGYGSGSSAVVKSHRITDESPVFKIKTADGRELKGNEAELWKYREVIDEYRLKKNPSTKWVSGYYKIEKTLEERIVKGKMFHLIKWKGFESPLWNTWIPVHEVKDAKDVFKKKPVSKKKSNIKIHTSLTGERYIIKTTLTGSGAMGLQYL
ncbi:hypothetical protein B9Z55_022727 [Caenorhabditis nigoni]|uniref:Chromo domain-containing protein n=1 Tax=Caenorhabditis nigoni TaxID=1611254 RepID=A0A2G5SM30_9PELO|nr:hypothetical protein B9Z55_022727 [Caenorhabditis nigoni]